MDLKTARWRPVAITLSAINVAALGFHTALEQGEFAGIHAILAGGFALWAGRLGRRRPAAIAAGAGSEARLEELEAELMDQRRELADAQERLDFAERLLAQAADRQRVLPSDVRP